MEASGPDPANNQTLLPATHAAIKLIDLRDLRTFFRAPSARALAGPGGAWLASHLLASSFPGPKRGRSLSALILKIHFCLKRFWLLFFRSHTAEGPSWGLSVSEFLSFLSLSVSQFSQFLSFLGFSEFLSFSVSRASMAHFFSSRTVP